MSEQGPQPWQQAGPPTTAPIAGLPPVVPPSTTPPTTPATIPPGTFGEASPATDPPFGDQPAWGDGSSGSPPPLTEEGPGYDPGPHHQRGSNQRPWWGIGDVLLMVPIMFGVLMVSFGLMVILAVVEGIDQSELFEGDVSTLPASMLVLPTLVQQAAWFIWPFMVSKWKGLGPVRDWGWAFKPVDIGIGIGTAFIAMFAAALIGTAVGAAVGLDDNAAAENTQILTDLKGSPWLYGLLFIVVIGAPLSEEVLFRGLIMRSFEKRWGAVAGVAASVLLFVPLHIADGGIFSTGQLVLWATIAALGTVLAIAALVSRRLAGPIIAHVIINSIGAAAALGAFDQFTDNFS